jgi:hypothetical protein
VDACAELPHELIEIMPLRRSACIHGTNGLPEPAPLSDAAVIALIDAEESDLEAIDGSDLGPAGPDSPAAGSDEAADSHADREADARVTR